MTPLRVLESAFGGLSEILSVLSRNKLRTGLTALTVAWGMFLFALLLGAGRGLENGAEWEFRDKAVNSIWVDGWTTSVPFAGRQTGRRVYFKHDDFDALRREVPGIDALSKRYYVWGEFFVSYRDRRAAFSIQGVHPDDRYIERTDLLRGRFLNERDLEERRKVAVIGQKVRERLFGDADPVGQVIRIRGWSYLVVGEFFDIGAPAELRKIFIPVTTAQLINQHPDRLHVLLFTLLGHDLQASRRAAEQTRELLGRRHRVAPEDRRAIRVRNYLEQASKMTQVLSWIRVFVWVTSIGTLLAGVVSVGNILLIAVAERTNEIGVRKALGATPLSIVWMIVFESILIVALSGYVGLVAGVLAVEAASGMLTDTPFMREPSVDLKVTLQAAAILVSAGVLAGLVPALRAARVEPSVALRQGN